VENRLTNALPLIAALTTVVMWAAAFVGIRAAGRELSAGPLSLGRLVVAAVVLGVFVAIRRAPFPKRRDWLPIIGLGVLWFGAYNVMLNEGERHVDAGTAAMVVNVGPLLIAILAGVVLKEGFPRPLVAGIAVAFLGTVVIGLATSSSPTTNLLGTILCLGAALAYSIAVTLQKPLLSRVSALQLTWLACTIGAIACLPFAPQLIVELRDAHGSTIAWTVFLGLGPTALAFTTWAYALARTSAGKMGVTTYLVSPIAILLGWLFLSEVPPWLAIVGGALCLAGVAVARYWKPKVTSPDAASPRP
jgi:drug/metabolite transporter (DMT)-like permease